MSLCRNGMGNMYHRAQVGQSPEDYSNVGASQSTYGTMSVQITDPGQVPVISPQQPTYYFSPGMSPNNWQYDGYGPCPDGYYPDGYGGCLPYSYAQQYQAAPCAPCAPCAKQPIYRAAPSRPVVQFRR